MIKIGKFIIEKNTNTNEVKKGFILLVNGELVTLEGSTLWSTITLTKYAAKYIIKLLETYEKFKLGEYRSRIAAVIYGEGEEEELQQEYGEYLHTLVMKLYIDL